MIKAVILISGSGSTMVNLCENAKDIEVVGVVASREKAAGIQKAEARSIPTIISKDSKEIFEFCRELKADLVCLAGYLSLVAIPDDFKHKVLNIHPSLLPKHGGKGLYGDKVHKSVLAPGDLTTGCTVHIADNEYDNGKRLVQRACRVSEDDTVESLKQKVFHLECEAYPTAITIWRRLYENDAL